MNLPRTAFEKLNLKLNHMFALQANLPLWKSLSARGVVNHRLQLDFEFELNSELELAILVDLNLKSSALDLRPFKRQINVKFYMVLTRIDTVRHLI